MAGDGVNDSRSWVDELIDRTLAYAAEVCGLPALGLVEGAPWLPIWQRVDSGVLEPRSYRTEPIEGAELGGRPRNPEDDVVDEISRLVDWQLEEGKR